MKRIFILAVLLLSFAYGNAQSPQKMSFQAVIRNSSNSLVSNLPIGLRVSIVQGTPSGAIVYSESQTANTNVNGLVTIQIGGGNVIQGNFSTIEWANGPYFIQTETDVNGGTNYTITSTTQLLSVPYALYAQTSGSSTPGPQGPAGPQGITGTNGTNGIDGEQGPQGIQGEQGPIGLTGETGPAGANGTNGIDGAQGPQGVAGTNGTNGVDGAQGPQGPAGANGINGTNGTNGTNGLSAYQVWLNLGNVGTEADFIVSLSGPQGPSGANGIDGKNTLVNTTTEPAGANCDNGGTKIEVGLDSNNNSILDAGEVNSSLTKFICNQGQSLPSGVNFGDVLSWNGINWVSTSPLSPLLTTSQVSEITSNLALSGGNVIYDGGLPIIARGVCWSTSPNPTDSLSTKTNDGTGSGIFSSNISGLLPNTTYYIRAYASNSVVTAYGTQLTFTTNLIGEPYQGGIIYYILQPGDNGFISGETHGLIASASDQSTSATWWNGQNLTTGAFASSIGSGMSNTNLIISSQGNVGSYAALICKNYNGGGYNDWFLPSQDEMNKMVYALPYLNIASCNQPSCYYWTSTEFGGQNNYARYFFYANGANALNDKFNALRVRAVRAF